MVVIRGRTTMSETLQCVHCGKPIKADPRVKNQRYCSDKECQRARRRQWQREKLLSDPDYKANQRDCQRKWREHHPGYYRDYRQRHPQSRERNRLPQQPPADPSKDCNNGRVPARASAHSNPLLPAPGDCKNGPVSTKSDHHSSRLVQPREIAKEDSIASRHAP